MTLDFFKTLFDVISSAFLTNKKKWPLEEILPPLLGKVHWFLGQSISFKNNPLVPATIRSFRNNTLVALVSGIIHRHRPLVPGKIYLLQEKSTDFRNNPTVS